MHRFRQVEMLLTTLVLFSSAVTVSADEKQAPSRGDNIAWGKAVDGLQLGILPVSGQDGRRSPLFDGTTLCVSIQIRNSGTAAARILPNTFGCAALGHCAGIPVTKLILTPIQGGDPISITYQGVNHVTEDQELDSDDLKYYTTVLAPGKVLDYSYDLRFEPGEDRATSWRRTGKSNVVPDGKYKLKAVFLVDRRDSPWKGELISDSLEVEIRQKHK